MPKQPRLTSEDAERLLMEAGFQLIRTKGGHRIYFTQDIRVVLPFHAGRILHPKIVGQVLRAISRVNH